jgi:tetratricopeptide (TPR) repeat protein
MNLRRWLPLCLLAPLLLGAKAATELDIEALIRAGNADFERGDMAEAARFYDRASERTTEPRLVAFNLGTAKYHLARTGAPEALADAEQAYRCCLEKGDPRRARALFGLGNCMLLRAAGASLDSLALRSAIDRYSECLADPSCDSELAADARYNRQRARLLLLQAPPPPDSSSEEGESGDKPDDLAEPPKDPEGSQQGGTSEEGGDKGAKPTAARGGDEQPGGDKEGSNAPGQGTLPPLHDGGDARPIARNDAEEHLKKATERIIEEARQYRRSRARPAASGVRDW